MRMRRGDIMDKRKCYECGSSLSMGFEYSWENKFLGEFSILCNEGEFYSCTCGNELISLSLLRRIEQEEQKRVEQLLLNSVDCDFEKYKNELIPCNELGRVLGISRQAISKNRRIKTLIFKVIINRETFYWKDSAVLFKKSGDGRFDLRKHQTIIIVEKAKVNKQLFSTPIQTLHDPNYTSLGYSLDIRSNIVSTMC